MRSPSCTREESLTAISNLRTFSARLQTPCVPYSIHLALSINAFFYYTPFRIAYSRLFEGPSLFSCSYNYAAFLCPFAASLLGCPLLVKRNSWPRPINLWIAPHTGGGVAGQPVAGFLWRHKGRVIFVLQFFAKTDNFKAKNTIFSDFSILRVICLFS